MGLALNDVVFVSYTSVVASASTAAAAASSSLRRLAAASYTLVAELQTSPLVPSDSSAEAVYAALTQSLTNAVEASNVFTSNLQTYAAQNNANAVATATASAVVNGSPEETTPPSSPSSSPSSSY
jgi:hypothetical protein